MLAIVSPLILMVYDCVNSIFSDSQTDLSAAGIKFN